MRSMNKIRIHCNSLLSTAIPALLTILIPNKLLEVPLNIRHDSAHSAHSAVIWRGHHNLSNVCEHVPAVPLTTHTHTPSKANYSFPCYSTQHSTAFVVLPQNCPKNNESSVHMFFPSHNKHYFPGAAKNFSQHTALSIIVAMLEAN